MSTAIKVPWKQGTEVTGKPAEPKAKPKSADLIASKRLDIERELATLEARSWPDWSIAFQRRRIKWLEWCEKKDCAQLRKRAEQIEQELGADGMRYALSGLPEVYAKDRRLLDLLGEHAIIRYVLRSE